MNPIFAIAPAAVAPSVDPTAAVLANLMGGAVASPAAPSTDGKPARKKSEYWLNFGFKFAGAGKDGADLFISPFGIALDDLKPEEIRTSNAQMADLLNAKNNLLEQVQRMAASCAPGQKIPVPQLVAEVSRVNGVAAPTTDGLANLIATAFK